MQIFDGKFDGNFDGNLMGHLMMDSKGWPYDSFDCLSFYDVTELFLLNVKELIKKSISIMTILVEVCS